MGHPGNEKADQLAHEAANIKEIFNSIRLPYSHFKSHLSDIAYKIWASCRLSKNFLLYPSKNKSKDILKLSRSQMRRLIELITGQNNLNYIQSKVNPDLSEMCRFCEEEEETFAHLLNECP